MKYKLLYTLQAKKDLVDFEAKIAKKILDKLDFYIQTGEPLKYSKKELIDLELATIGLFLI